MIRLCRLHSNPSVLIIPISAEAKKIPTMTYTVGDRDTLTSVAARFDTTPSELTSLNRLVGSFVYPGQQLLVPDKDKILEGSETTSEKSSPVNGSRDNLQDEKGRINFLVMKYDYGNHPEIIIVTRSTISIFTNVTSFCWIKTKHCVPIFSCFSVQSCIAM